MTLLPTDSWNVKPRLDLEPYELNTVCPVTGWTDVLEDHHIWRKSFTALSREDGKRLFWVELEDGTVLPNRVRLASGVHRDVTDNRARIFYNGGVFSYVDDEGKGCPLSPQPGPPMQQTIDGKEEPWEQHKHTDEEECSRCHGTGKVAKKPKTEQPQTAERKKTTWSVRVPKDERENGYEVLDTNVGAAVDKLADADLIRDRNRGANYYTLVYALAFFLQNFKPETEKAA